MLTCRLTALLLVLGLAANSASSFPANFDGVSGNHFSKTTQYESNALSSNLSWMTRPFASIAPLRKAAWGLIVGPSLRWGYRWSGKGLKELGWLRTGIAVALLGWGAYVRYTPQAIIIEPIKPPPDSEALGYDSDLFRVEVL